MRDDLAIPALLSPLGEKAAQAILSILRKYDALHTGGCRAFYSPQEWTDRGEEYGCESVLLVVHDGGDVARFFNHDYQMPGRMASMDAALADVGLYAQPCTTWYTAIYPVGP